MSGISSELLAKQMCGGPICDNCHTFLFIHGDTLNGQLCDLNLAMRDVGHSLGKSILGERRYEKTQRMTKGTEL